MSRLARIVCDNPECNSQAEWYAPDYFRAHAMSGYDDTPVDWFKLTYHAPQTGEGTARSLVDMGEPRYFCCIACVQKFSGEIKRPENRDDSI